MKFFLNRRRKIGSKPMEFKHILPNMVTSGNLLCGLFSLILVLHGRIVPAAWLIFFAVIFDGFDGKVARMLGGGSQFGLEFDILADLVSFGVAPSILLYHVSMRSLHIIGAAAAVFFALCVALRLARFNVVHVPGPFQGLPCPAGGLFISSFILAGFDLPPYVLAFILACTGLLMISSIPYANLKKLTKKSADKVKCFALFMLLLLILIYFIKLETLLTAKVLILFCINIYK